MYYISLSEDEQLCHSDSEDCPPVKKPKDEQFESVSMKRTQSSTSTTLRLLQYA